MLPESSQEMAGNLTKRYRSATASWIPLLPLREVRNRSRSAERLPKNIKTLHSLGYCGVCHLFSLYPRIRLHICTSAATPLTAFRSFFVAAQMIGDSDVMTWTQYQKFALRAPNFLRMIVPALWRSWFGKQNKPSSSVNMRLFSLSSFRCTPL